MLDGEFESSVKSKQLDHRNTRARHAGFSPVIAAVVALEALAFIALGAATQTELHVTVLDVVISVAAIATVFGTAGLAKPREVSATAVTREMDTLELEQVRRRIAVHAPQYAQMDGPLAERPLAERLKSAKLQRPSFPIKILRDAGIRAGEPSAAWAAEFRHATGTAGGVEGLPEAGAAHQAAPRVAAQRRIAATGETIGAVPGEAIAARAAEAVAYPVVASRGWAGEAPTSQHTEPVAAVEEPAPLAHDQEVADDVFDWTAAMRAEVESLGAAAAGPQPVALDSPTADAEQKSPDSGVEEENEEAPWWLVEKKAALPAEPYHASRSSGEEGPRAEIVAEDRDAPELSALVRALDSLRDASAPVPDAPPVAAETNGPRAVRETGAGEAVPTARARVRRTSRPSPARRRGRRLVRDGARRAVGAAASGPDDEDPLRRTLTLITPGAAPATDRPELLLRLNLDGDTLAALLRLVEQGANVQSVQPKLVTLPGGKLDAQPS